jgi:cellulose 1,4-beta-cellobiosidase
VAATTGPGTGQITVTWNGSANATIYHLHRSTTPGGAYTLIDVNATTSNTSYSDTGTGLTTGQTYYYVIVAVNGTYDTDSQPSAQVSAVPLK